MKIVFHPNARAEVDDATEWYELHNPQLGLNGFLCDFRETLTRIRDNPESYALSEDAPVAFNVRYAPMHRFPFRVVYWVQDSCLVILAVAHHRRRPGYWLTRLEDKQN